MVIVEGQGCSRRTWRRVRRWYLATGVLWLVVRFVVSVGVLIAGGGLPLWDEGGQMDPGATTSRRRERWTAGLVIRRTTGWPRSWQVDFMTRWSIRFRGEGAVAAGVLSASGGGILWAPRGASAALGCRRFILQISDVERIEITKLSTRLSGLVIRQGEDVEVWLWMRKDQADSFLDAVEESASTD